MSTKDESKLELYRTYTLTKLHTQHDGLQKSIPEHQRHISILDAQIQGLLDYQPEGFEARVEALWADVTKRQNILDMCRYYLPLLKQVIEEKEAAL